MAIYSKADGHMIVSGDLYKSILKDLNSVVAACNKAEEENESDEFTNNIKESAQRQIDHLKTGGIKNPFLSLIGFTTPVTFNDLVSYQSATNGFIGRAIIFEEKESNPIIKKDFRPCPIDNGLKMKLNTVCHGGDFSFTSSPRTT